MMKKATRNLPSQNLLYNRFALNIDICTANRGFFTPSHFPILQNQLKRYGAEKETC